MNVLKARKGQMVLAAVGGILVFVAAAFLVDRDAEPPLLVDYNRAEVPADFEAFGRSLVSADLDFSKPSEDAEKRGRVLYQKYCLACHGGNLDGKGRHWLALNPPPTNFMASENRARLNPRWMFWRIATGGEGLPVTAAPLGTAMPRWDTVLKQDDVLALVRYLDAAIKQGGSKSAGQSEVLSGRDIYLEHCASCHGKDGRGDGASSQFMDPAPRSFWLGVFKYKTTHADVEFPSDEDLRQTIKTGLPGTAMAGWSERLTDREIDAVIETIKELGMWADEGASFKPVYTGTQIPSDEASLARGKKVYQKNCEQCHGLEGRGDVTSGKRLKDDLGARIWPRNLTRRDTWRKVRTHEDLFTLVSTGIRGTPMPQHTKSVRLKDRWHVVNYVMTLGGASATSEPAPFVLKSKRAEGALPRGADDVMWQDGQGVLLRFAPNSDKILKGQSLLNETARVQAFHTEDAVAMLIEMDDRTYSVPGSERERLYALAGVRAGRDGFGLRTPAGTLYKIAKSIRPARGSVARFAPSFEDFLHTDFSKEPGQSPDEGMQIEATWKDGQWRIYIRQELPPGKVSQLYPVQFINMDGLHGDTARRFNHSGWWWLDVRD